MAVKKRGSVQGAEAWLTVVEAADHLRVSRDTIYRWAKRGKLTLYKLGGLTRVRRSDLDSLLVPAPGARCRRNPWTAVSDQAFSDWENPEDAVYDRWTELYGVPKR